MKQNDQVISSPISFKTKHSFLSEMSGKLSCPTNLKTVTFAISTHCNLQCKGCGRTIGVENGTWDSQHMSVHTFEAVLNNLPSINVAVMQGVGEPTLNPDFIAICKLAKESGKINFITFHTNGVTRSPEYFLDLSKYVNDFAISVDTLNHHFIDNTRSGTNIEKLKSRIRGLYEMGIAFRINMVISRYNLCDVTSTLKILNDLGKFSVGAQVLETQSPEDPALVTSHDLEALKRHVEEMAPLLPNIRFSMNTSGVSNARDDQVFCKAGAPALAPYVLPSGYLTPCCRSDDPRLFGFGDLKRQSFAQIWESEAVQSYLRHFFINGDTMCDGCQEYGRSLKSHELRKVQDHERLVNTVLPSINFCLSISDAESALGIATSYVNRYPDNEGARILSGNLRQIIRV
jgi:MoaA/NifB/PqqE/SkfB family radical SAM enzyme